MLFLKSSITYWRRKWQPTPAFLPGESQGRQSLVGCCLWGRTESDTTEVTQQQQQYHLREDVSYIFLKESVKHKLEQIQTNFVFCPLLFICQEWKNIAGLAVFSILSSVFIYQVPLYSEVKVKAHFLDIPSSFPKPGCRHTFLNPDLLIQQYIMKILPSFLLIVMISNRQKTHESPLDCKEIQPAHPKGDKFWVFIGRTDAEPETQ